MTLNFRNILLILVLAATAIIRPAQAQNITFGRLTTDDGLSQFSVNTLYHDTRGFIWIGTREGLNLYNGNNIQTFKLRKGDPASLFSNTILRITGDEAGNLFLLCAEGVTRFDLRREEFHTLVEGKISAIHYHEGLYVASGTELFRCSPDTGELVPYKKLPNDVQGQITCLLHDSRGRLWIGTDRHGFFSLTAEGGLEHHVTQGNVTSFYEDSTGTLWAGTWDKGLYKHSGGGSAWTNQRSASGGLLSDFVRCFVEDNQGNIWIGTFLGLNKFDPKTGTISAYKADGQSGSLTHSSIWCLIKDPQGTIWAGTYFGGVNYFNPEYEIYTQYKTSAEAGGALSSPIVGKMIEQGTRNLWICTEGGGVNVLDRATGQIRHYTHTPGSNSISHNNVKAICYDPKRRAMWIGTHLGGLNRLDLATDRFTHYRNKPGDTSTIPSDIVRDILLYGDRLIVATNEGVCLFDPGTGRAERLFRDNIGGYRVTTAGALAFDKQGTLWIAALNEGLYSYRFDTGELANYRNNPNKNNSLSCNNINSIVTDHAGNLWIATSGRGLDRYRYETDDFENFDAQSNGLSSDCIYDLRDPQTGELLVITNQGLSRFDCATQRFDNYTLENGFPLTAINENAICLAHDGTLFLGGTQGLVSFDERALDFPSKPYNIVLNSLSVNGQSVSPGDATGILGTALCYDSSITIPPRYSVFSIEFATSNFIPANRERIVYRLEGFSDEWTPVRGQQVITYTNLNPGRYTLVIRSTEGPDALRPEARLEIEILPPFYRTAWAWMLYILLTGGIVWALIRTYLARIRLQESLRYEQQHIRDVEELNQSKLRFFTNISHEFRTPLTLIIGQVEMLLQVQSFTPTIYNKVLRVYKNSMQLKELIGELLDFRKQEQGHMKIRASEQDLVAFLDENYLIFLEYAAHHNIRFRFDKNTETLPVWFDRVQLQKVVNNLLSNALKHTPEEGQITLWVRGEAERTVFGVTDSGRGISAEDLGRIFERFYQTKESESTMLGTGIGLALSKGIVELHHGTIGATSEAGKGSTFEVTLPLGAGHLMPEQITEEAPAPLSTVEPTAGNAERAFVQEREEMDEGVYKRIKGARMLIVEDNTALREMLENLFAPYYDITTAADGEQGWEKVVESEPQIVLSDVVMPRLSGTGLCRRIKSNIDTCHIPVVLLTARTSVEHNIEGLRTGADDYITKPFNVPLLLSRCNNLVNNRIVLREKFSRQPTQPAQMLATNPLDKELIDRAMRIIGKYLDDPEFNINVFAREMGMARTKLFAKMKAITDTTPNEFISTIRLKTAASLLNNNPEMTIAEIADQTGFGSPRYFSKCFKAQFGVSPLSYRKGFSEDPAPEGTDDPDSADEEA